MVSPCSNIYDGIFFNYSMSFNKTPMYKNNIITIEFKINYRIPYFLLLAPGKELLTHFLFIAFDIKAGHPNMLGLFLG